MNALVIATTLIVLVSTIAYGSLKKYQLKAAFANILLAIYILFILAATTLAIKQIFE
jgi:hypothetical protein